MSAPGSSSEPCSSFSSAATSGSTEYFTCEEGEEREEDCFDLCVEWLPLLPPSPSPPPPPPPPPLLQPSQQGMTSYLSAVAPATEGQGEVSGINTKSLKQDDDQITLSNEGVAEKNPGRHCCRSPSMAETDQEDAPANQEEGTGPHDERLGELLIVGPLPSETENPYQRPRRYVVFCSTLLCLLSFVVADVSLRFVGSSNSDRWFLLLLRSGCQILGGFIVALICRAPPWKPTGRIALFITIGFVSACLVWTLDTSSRRIPLGIEATLQLSVPLTTMIFSVALCIEVFHMNQVIIVALLLASILLFLHPWSAATYVPPSLTLDPVFSFPLGTASLPEGIRYQCLAHFESVSSSSLYADSASSSQCPPDLSGLLAGALNPVLSAYLVVLVCVCRNAHVAVITIWSGTGILLAAIYGIMSTASFSELDPDLSWVAVAGGVASAIFGTLGFLLFLIVLHRIGPIKAIVIRISQLVINVMLQSLLFGERSFTLADLAGSSLVAIAASYVAVEQLFFK